jgi:hypothetical protein
MTTDEGWRCCALSFKMKSTEFLPSTFDTQYAIFCGSRLDHSESYATSYM